MIYTPNNCKSGLNDKCSFELDSNLGYIRTLSVCKNHRGLQGIKHFKKIKDECFQVAQVQIDIDKNRPHLKIKHYKKARLDDGSEIETNEIEYEEYPIEIKYVKNNLVITTADITDKDNDEGEKPE